MHSEALMPCVVAGLVGVAVGMLTMSAFLAIVLWAAAALAGKIRERDGDE